MQCVDWLPGTIMMVNNIYLESKWNILILSLSCTMIDRFKIGCSSYNYRNNYDQNIVHGQQKWIHQHHCKIPSKHTLEEIASKLHVFFSNKCYLSLLVHVCACKCHKSDSVWFHRRIEIKMAMSIIIDFIQNISNLMVDIAFGWLCSYFILFITVPRVWIDKFSFH